MKKEQPGKSEMSIANRPFGPTNTQNPTKPGTALVAGRRVSANSGEVHEREFCAKPPCGRRSVEPLLSVFALGLTWKP